MHRWQATFFGSSKGIHVVGRKPIGYAGIPLSAKPFGPGPLSPAVAAGPFLFISGQVGIDPITGKVAGSDAKSQTRQTLLNMQTLLESAGLAMDDVVKTNVFLTRVSDFEAMNEVYREFLAAPYPARSSVVIALANPDLLVEIEGIALLKSGKIGP
jgi:2-iminobutanoate/2-iminopropanoate deaminase